MLMIKLAFRNVLRQKRRTFLTMLSMVGGYFLLVVSISVQMGSYAQVIGFFTKDSTGHAQITHVGYQDRPTLYKTVPVTEEFYQGLMAIPEVTQATPRIVSGALAYGVDKSFPVQVIGVDVKKESELSYLSEKVKQGSYFSSAPDVDGYYQVMVGAAVARQLKLSVGDEIVLISQGADGSIANDIYLVSGVVGTSKGLDARNIYMPLIAAQSFYTLYNQAHYWAVLTDNYQDSDALTLALTRWVNERPELEAVSWKVVSKDFYRTMQADIQGGYISYYIIILLVCIGVLNTVLMSVMERTSEFGVLRAIGTSPIRLFLLIVSETLILASLSCVIGLILALPVNYYLSVTGFSLPEPMEVSGVFMEQMRGLWQLNVFIEPAIIILVSTAVISIFPALRAARIVPIDALRSV